MGALEVGPCFLPSGSAEAAACPGGGIWLAEPQLRFGMAEAATPILVVTLKMCCVLFKLLLGDLAPDP